MRASPAPRAPSDALGRLLNPWATGPRTEPEPERPTPYTGVSPDEWAAMLLAPAAPADGVPS